MISERTTLASDGTLLLPQRVIDETWLQAGDELLISPLAPGLLQLRKGAPWEALPFEEVERRIRQALIEAGVDTKDKVIELVREVRREMAAEW